MSTQKLIRMVTITAWVFGLSICVACPEDYDDRVRLAYEDCQANYDRRTNQKLVTTDAEIQSTLRSLTQVNFHDLDPRYIAYTKIDQEVTNTNHNTADQTTLDYRKETFYAVRGDEQFRYLVGHFRVVDFLPNSKSPGYSGDPFHLASRELACTDDSDDHLQYLLIDPLLLKRLNLLLTLLRNSPHEYDDRALSIYYGFRHPHMNEVVKGAKRSQHLWGKAVDIKVGDINRDGKADRTDKNIVLSLLEKKVIGSQGGIGRYPHSPTEIHIDVRGWYARWDR